MAIPLAKSFLKVCCRFDNVALTRFVLVVVEHDVPVLNAQVGKAFQSIQLLDEEGVLGL